MTRVGAGAALVAVAFSAAVGASGPALAQILTPTTSSPSPAPTSPRPSPTAPRPAPSPTSAPTASVPGAPATTVPRTRTTTTARTRRSTTSTSTSTTAPPAPTIVPVAPSSTVPDVPTAIDPVGRNAGRLPKWTVALFILGVAGFVTTIGVTWFVHRPGRDGS